MTFTGFSITRGRWRKKRCTVLQRHSRKSSRGSRTRILMTLQNKKGLSCEMWRSTRTHARTHAHTHTHYMTRMWYPLLVRVKHYCQKITKKNTKKNQATRAAASALLFCLVEPSRAGRHSIDRSRDREFSKIVNTFSLALAFVFGQWILFRCVSLLFSVLFGVARVPRTK